MRGQRLEALGIMGVRPRVPAITDYLAAAKDLAKGTNLVIFTSLNSKGDVIHYTLKRHVGGRWIFCGERTDARGLYILVGRCKRTEGSTA